MRIFLQALSIFAFFTFVAVVFILANDISFIKKVDPTVIYGEWVEKGVPLYAADRFEVRKKGIYMNGSRITGHYEFTGRELIYTVGDNTYVYSVENDNELIREKPFHYTAPFRKVT